VDPHRPAAPAGNGLLEGPALEDHHGNPGFDEYRQIHLAATNPGLWPATPGVETAIPTDRKVDVVAEVTFRSVLSPLFGRKQTRFAYADEINVFRRTLLYAGPPNSTRWYDLAAPGEQIGARTRRMSHTTTHRPAVPRHADARPNSYPSRNRSPSGAKP
jgi:hypothetical protein